MFGAVARGSLFSETTAPRLSRMIIHYVPSAIHHVPFTTHHSPLTTRHSPLTTHLLESIDREDLGAEDVEQADKELSVMHACVRHACPQRMRARACAMETPVASGRRRCTGWQKWADAPRAAEIAACTPAHGHVHVHMACACCTSRCGDSNPSSAESSAALTDSTIRAKTRS